RRIEWLFGRIAAKDAVRDYISRRTEYMLPPADIEIRAEKRGRPEAVVSGLTPGFQAPSISISHCGDWAVAAAVGTEYAVGIDSEPVSRSSDLNTDFLRTAIQPEEDTLVPSADANVWRLRIWCAKEAAAKADGVGLGSGLLAMRVRRLNTHSGEMEV